MSKEGKFLIFCLECYRQAKKLSGQEVIKLFNEHNLFDYITTYFESLHTTGVRYILNDLDERINRSRMAAAV